MEPPRGSLTNDASVSSVQPTTQASMYKQKRPVAKKKKRSRRKASVGDDENDAGSKQQLTRKSSANLTNITNLRTDREGELLTMDESCTSTGEGQHTQANVLALNRIQNRISELRKIDALKQGLVEMVDLIIPDGYYPGETFRAEIDGMGFDVAVILEVSAAQ